MRAGHLTRCTSRCVSMRGVTGCLNGLMSELATGLTAYGVVTDPPATFLAEAKSTCGGPRGLRRWVYSTTDMLVWPFSKLWQYFGNKPQSPDSSPTFGAESVVFVRLSAPSLEGEPIFPRDQIGFADRGLTTWHALLQHAGRTVLPRDHRRGPAGESTGARAVATAVAGMLSSTVVV
jgi:hypothetical protein